MKPVRRTFVAAIALGLLVRAVALPLPGTGDVEAFKVWAYHAATDGPTRVYGVEGGAPHRTPLVYDGTTSRVNYPPLAVYALALPAWIFGRLAGGFPNGPAFTVAIKLPALAATTGLLALMFVVARRRLGDGAAEWAGTAFWLNPASILAGAVLGYLDPLFALPALGAVAAAADGWPIWTGVWIAAAVLIKPQALLVVPAVVLALVTVGGPGAARRLWQASGAGLAVAAVVVAPYVFRGTLLNLGWSLASLARDPYLSADACNLWWVVGFVHQVAARPPGVGLAAALAGPVSILRTADLAARGPDPRVIAAILVAGASGWALWQARGARDVWMIAALAAFHVHVFALLATGVHENHIYAAVPLLVLASAGRRRFAPVMIALSGVFAANLFLLYGFGRGLGPAVWPPAAPIDLTVLVALANCGVFAWHAAVFAQECQA